MAEPEGQEKKLSTMLVSEAKSHATIVGGFVGLLWLVQVVNFLSGGQLTQLGVHPRTISGLFGILFAPFIHASFAHLIANTVPLAVLSWFVMLRQKRDLITVSTISALVGGLGIWLIAPSDSVHIGASILIFGYLGYLLARGVFEKRFWPIVGSVVTFLAYGGALFGIFPGQQGISWQGHLFGLIGGIIAARLLSKAPIATAKRVAPQMRIAASAPKALGASQTLPGASPAEDHEDIEAEMARLRRMR